MAALEYTPELDEKFRSAMTKRISDRGVSRAGAARSEALSRGLGGDPYEASSVGLANQGTDQELNAFDAQLGYNVAGLNREERLGTQQRGYQVEDRNFGAAENEKDRSLPRAHGEDESGLAGRPGKHGQPQITAGGDLADSSRRGGEGGRYLGRRGVLMPSSPWDGFANTILNEFDSGFGMGRGIKKDKEERSDKAGALKVAAQAATARLRTEPRTLDSKSATRCARTRTKCCGRNYRRLKLDT